MKKRLICAILSLVLILCAAPAVFSEEYEQLYFGTETTWVVQPKTNSFLELHPENGPNIDLSYTVTCDPEIGVIDKLEDGVVDQYMLRVTDRMPGVKGKIYAVKDGVKYAIDVIVDYPTEGFYTTADKTSEGYIVRGADGRYTLEYDSSSRSLFFITNGAKLDNVVANSRDVLVSLSNDKTTAAITAKSSLSGDRTVVISYSLTVGDKTTHNIQTLYFRDIEPAVIDEPVDVPEEPVKKYTDVPEGSWMEEGVNFVSKMGYFKGYPDDSFGVNESMNRAMMAVVIYRMSGSPEYETKKSFSDVEPDSWYGKEVAWCAENGIINGYDGGEFKPEALVSREMLAVLLYRMAGSPAQEGEIEGASAWANDAMVWAVGTGIIQGDGTSYDPQGTATRAQVAKIIMSFKMLDNK